ncbi:polyphosphate kinase 2 family protein [Alteromonas sp. PRIM-21]|uniref:polyphosphate kinase 2 family protein n=1 Tax=Alteromonas sp. PRIM-21 TaxID=1454978 RepID=UPI0022B95203|nr:PPK2 family polyphosphate kinase [Alteromonas sp. PRIM-21]MCZ8528856.1 polyphosphate kinase [Alteromonas sp. PRIM-21]
MSSSHQKTIVTLFDDFGRSRFNEKEEYKNQLSACQESLFHVQQSYYHQKRRALIVFEGWDASGKGGAIRRITEKLDPRSVNVFPVSAPTQEEREKHFLYRFWKQIPSPGKLTIFDRSHYGRVLVERVDGLTPATDWQRSYQEINEFEKTLSDNGVRIIKLFMHISADEQRERFEERLHNPFKRWKLTEEDLHNRRMREHYVEAINDMFEKTHTDYAPWHIINGEYKWQARVDVLETLVQALSEGVDITPPPLDEKLIAMASKQLDVNEEKLRSTDKE